MVVVVEGTRRNYASRFSLSCSSISCSAVADITSHRSIKVADRQNPRLKLPPDPTEESSEEDRRLRLPLNPRERADSTEAKAEARRTRRARTSTSAQSLPRSASLKRRPVANGFKVKSVSFKDERE